MLSFTARTVMSGKRVASKAARCESDPFVIRAFSCERFFRHIRPEKRIASPANGIRRRARVHHRANTGTARSHAMQHAASRSERA